MTSSSERATLSAHLAAARTPGFTTPEMVAARLRERREAGKGGPELSALTRKLRKLAQAVKGILHAR